MANIYDRHRAAFGNVSAFVIMQGGERVASVALKFPRDGAGRLYAYVHFFGMPMVRGFAGGYGYDKRTAAVEDAMKKINPAYFAGDGKTGSHWEKERDQCEAFRDAISKARDGVEWADSFRKAGFTVLQAV